MSNSSWHTCNILHSNPTGDRLWHFNSGSTGPKLSGEVSPGPGGVLPPKLVKKEWRTLWQKKFNLAWYPPNRIYVRVIELPICDPSELRSMVEFQIEKLSPLPVAQIVWGVEPMPLAEGAETQSVIVIIAELAKVEAFLEGLEEREYMVDAIDLFSIRQLLALENTGDGIWVIPGVAEESDRCLVAWWIDGSLRNLNLLQLPEGDEAVTSLVGHLSQMAWAGEMEGWLKEQPKCHLVANPEEYSGWAAKLKEWSTGDVESVPAKSVEELAELSVRNVEPTTIANNLIPEEFSILYKQQFVDRLWMRGLGAILALYVIGVIIYFGFVNVVAFQRSGEEAELTPLKSEYEAVLGLEEKKRLLEDQAALKFAALDCLLAIAENLPTDLKVESIGFNQGKSLTINGVAPLDKPEAINEFNDALGLFLIPDDEDGDPRLLFEKVDQPATSTRKTKEGTRLDWRFRSILTRETKSEEEVK